MTSEVSAQEALIASVAVSEIDPSPFQHRRAFDGAALAELGRSIANDGLLQPITVRRIGERYELIAGERRWRAAKDHAGQAVILARILDVDDLQARRLCATENLQRADLTAIEEVMALAELIDADLSLAFGDEYRSLSKIDSPKWRVKALLTGIESDRKNGTEKVSNKFVAKTDAVFAGLPKAKDRTAFVNHDLPLLFTSDEVQQFAMEHRLNKSQTKAVAELQKASPEIFRSKEPEKVLDKVVERIVTASLPSYSTPEEIKEAVQTAKESPEAMRDFSANEINKAARKARLQTETGELMPINHRAQGTGENEWYTPHEHIEAARDVMGGIDLDPASSALANKAVGAKRFFTQDDDGLAQPWAGRIWMNPPYSQPAIAQFAEKLASEWDSGSLDAAIALTHNYTDTAWFHRLASTCKAICFTRGRIGFVSPKGEKAAPTQGQAFFYFGDDAQGFIDRFRAIGFVVEVRS